MSDGSIYLFGLNYKTAPLEMRERFALAGDGHRLAVKEIAYQTALIREAVILFTCNRLEFYLVAPDAHAAQEGLAAFWLSFYGEPLALSLENLYAMSGEQAVDHLLRVACGLESMVLGETQILGQVAEGYAKARSEKSLGPILSRLFETALHAGKRARTETSISQSGTSISHSAVTLAQTHLGALADKTVLVIGAGKMASLAAQAFDKAGVKQLVCLSRTFSKAKLVAQEVNGRAYNWHSLPKAICEADVVVSATSAPHAVIHVSNVFQVLPDRAGRPLWLFDIAIPRDIDPEVGELPGVRLFDIDALQTVVDETLEKRQAAVPDVESICAEEAAGFREWFSTLDMVPTIKDLRGKVGSIAEEELAQLLQKLNGASPEIEEKLNLMVHRIVQKILNEPTAYLRTVAAEGEGQVVATVVRELFALDE